jgi:hypothetical protein
MNLVGVLDFVLVYAELVLSLYVRDMYPIFS